MRERSDPQFEQLLEHLQQTRGFDFTAYKRDSLMRRVTKRMQTVGIDSYEEYLDYLQVHQEEFEALFNTILINVTSFFRDREVWDTLSNDVLPTLIRARHPDAPLRVWSAGCASGQEPCSVAMTLAEILGVEGVRDRVKIYATDVDEDALNQARQATYDERQVADVPAALLDKYFERKSTKYTLSRDLRRSIIFGRNDLLQDAPISRIDLLLCRNTLMYFNGDAQARILGRFHAALNPGGYVMLGRAEMLFSHGALFAPVDLKRRLFRGVPRPTHREPLMMFSQPGRDLSGDYASASTRLRNAAFESDTVPHIVLGASGTLMALNAPARKRFRLSVEDIGRRFDELEVSYRPVQLRDAVDEAVREQRTMTIKSAHSLKDSEERYFDVTIAPLCDDDGTALGVRISFNDVSAHRLLELELQHAKQ